MDTLKVENLHKRFPVKGGHHIFAVNGVGFSIRPGETLGLVGESGCGKSTVGRMIVRLTQPNEGELLFEGQNLRHVKRKNDRRLRREIQMVFQDPYGSLNPRKKVQDIIAEPMRLSGEKNKDFISEKVISILKMVELNEGYLDKYPIQLTQGEQQRVGVARAFVTDPKLVVLDEPTSLLDIRFRGEIVLLLKKLQQEMGCSYLFISHDLNIVYQLSHRVAVMYLGRIVEEGDAEQVFRNPLHPYTKALLSATLLPDPKQQRQEFFLKGEVPSPLDLSDNQCNFSARCPFASERCKSCLPEPVAVESGHKVSCFLSHPPFHGGGGGSP